tara:strand:- start:13638 stop:14102 length:465 start_codon:yes stop_codon:yes gene_type:complete
MNNYKKTQISMEFMLLITFMLFFFIVFFGVVQYRMAEATSTKEMLLLREVGDYVKNEISLAATVEDGYERTFETPIDVVGREYYMHLYKTANEDDDRVQYYLELSYLYQNSTIFVNLPYIDLDIGDKEKILINNGENLIKKVNGIITLEIPESS